MTIFSIIRREIRVHLAAYRVQRLLDKRKVKAARDLANIGHAKRKATVKSVARQMRDELGLAPDPRLA